MSNLLLFFDAVGVTAFLLAAGLAVKNYRHTKGITQYWLGVTTVALLGALSAACVLDEIMGAVVFGPMHNYHLAYPSLAVAVFTVSSAVVFRNRLAKPVMPGDNR